MKMLLFRWAFLTALLLYITSMQAACLPVPGKIRLLAITGGMTVEKSFHTVYSLKDVVVTNVTSAEEAFSQDVSGLYDVVLFYSYFPTTPDSVVKANIVRFAQSNKGIIVMHSSLANFQDWEWWSRDLVGGKYLYSKDPFIQGTSFKLDQNFISKPYKTHPILSFTEGLPLGFTDELYKHLWISQKVTPLLTCDDPNSDPVIAWISPYEDSRVVVIQPGHSSNCHYNWGFRLLVGNAIRWSAKRL